MDQHRFWNFYQASLDWKDQLLNRKIEALKFDRRWFDVSMESTDQIQSIDHDDEDEKNFLQFIVQTRKHQLARDQMKKELALKEEFEIEYKDIVEVETKDKLIHSKGPELREDLYGEKADEILNKELKLQFHFNEFCDKNQPNFWPNLPINLNIKQNSSS